MKRWTPLAVLLTVLLGGCGRTLSPQEARTLVGQVQAARRNTTLTARLLTTIRLEGQTLRSEATLARGPGVVQVEYLTGRFAGWKLFVQDGLVWRVDPQGKAQPSPAGADPSGLGMKFSPDLIVHYDGFGWAAGRRALRYTVAPPHAGPARVRLALDAQTLYPLRLLRYGPHGQLLSATTYESVNYKAPSPPRVVVPAVAARAEGHPAGRKTRVAKPEELAKMLGGPLLKPKYVPAGFQLSGTFLHETVRRKTAELRYSDGLRTLAVLQFTRPALAQRLPADDRGVRRQHENAEERRALWQRWQQTRGPGQANEGAHKGGLWGNLLRGDVVRERRGDRLIIVVGEVSRTELQKVLDSIPSAPGQARPAVKF